MLVGEEAESLIFLFCSLECLNCWWAGGGGLSHKVLFRADWKHIFRIPGFENVSWGWVRLGKRNIMYFLGAN